MEAVVFFFAAALALAAALGVVAFRNPFYSVLALVVHLFSLAILFLLLQAQFVAAAQVVLYVGAVMVLYVFVVAYIGGLDQPVGDRAGLARFAAPFFALALLVELVLAVVGSTLTGIDSPGAKVGADFGTPAQIGELFLTRFLLPFEVASFILLVAAVGAVVLARRRRGLELEGLPATFSDEALEGEAR